MRAEPNRAGLVDETDCGAASTVLPEHRVCWLLAVHLFAGHLLQSVISGSLVAHHPGTCFAPDGLAVARSRRREFIPPPRSWLVLTMDFNEGRCNRPFHRTEIRGLLPL